MNPETEVKIGLNLRRLRKEKRMTQEELSVRMQVAGCDITRSALAKIEVGQRHLYPDELILLKTILGAEYDEILKV